MIKLTKEQAEKCYLKFVRAQCQSVAQFSEVANALVEMGVVALPPKAEPDPYAEAKARAAKWGARLLKCNNGRYIFATDTAWWVCGAWDRRTDSLGKSDATISKMFYGYYPTESEAWANFTTDPPPGYIEPTPPAPGPTIEERLAALEAKANLPASDPFVPKPDPKPTPSLIEACAEAACSAHGCAATWEKTMFKEEWLASTRAAITRFLEEPVSEDDYTRCREVFQMDSIRAALNEYRRVLLDRVKGGV